MEHSFHYFWLEDGLRRGVKRAFVPSHATIVCALEEAIYWNYGTTTKRARLDDVPSFGMILGTFIIPKFEIEWARVLYGENVVYEKVEDLSKVEI